MGRTGSDGMDAAAGLNCAACSRAEEESDNKGAILLRCMGQGLRGVRGRVVSVYQEGYRGAEICRAPAWCERRKDDAGHQKNGVDPAENAAP